MPTTVDKLSASFLKRRQKEPGKYGDGNNLWLIVGPTGRERWEFRFTHAGKSREMSLGPVEQKTIYEAREEAKDLRRQLRAGINPLDSRAKPTKARATTFTDVANQCIGSL